jgi:Na+/glutamate symporter
VSGPRVEPAARWVAVGAAFTLLAILSATIGAIVGPILGPTVVAGVVAWWLVSRHLDERMVQRDQDRHDRKAEPLSLPQAFEPPRL